jgi:hypothetical protein
MPIDRAASLAAEIDGDLVPGTDRKLQLAR